MRMLHYHCDRSRRRAVSVSAGLLAWHLVGGAQGVRAPLGLDGLRALARSPVPLEASVPVDGDETYTARLLTYRHAALRLHALLATPRGTAPPGGWPVLLANHGYHPDPPRYGITPQGRDWRPGDYYRPIPRAFTAAGYQVVMADYRGHNRSDGLAYTRDGRAADYYAEDVVALAAVLAAVPDTNLKALYLWGHSMGGGITLAAALAVPGVRAASLWSTSALQRSPLPGEAALAELAVPVLLHHARGDTTTAYAGSEHLSQVLQRLGKPVVLHPYAGTSHFFSGESFDRAVARDVQFFRSRLPAAGP